MKISKPNCASPKFKTSICTTIDRYVMVRNVTNLSSKVQISYCSYFKICYFMKTLLYQNRYEALKTY